MLFLTKPLAFVFMGVVLLVLPLRVTQAQSSTGTFQSKILFTGARGQGSEIFLMNPDGSDLQNLTNSPAIDKQPAVAPDGQRIAFVSNRDGDFEIFVMGIDGSNPQQLTFNNTQDLNPQWSPDSTRIAFESQQGRQFDIHIIQADGSGSLRQLTVSEQDDYQPHWSPDGTKISFTSLRNRVYEAYVMDLNRSSLQPLGATALDSAPAWSPDGTKIAFETLSPGWEIGVMDVDGNNVQILTTLRRSSTLPRWSPDGRLLLFYSFLHDNTSFTPAFVGRIYVVDLATGQALQLTQDATNSVTPAWSPDGTQIIFASDPERDSRYVLEVMDVDGQNRRVLTPPELNAQFPVWVLIQG